MSKQGAFVSAVNAEIQAILHPMGGMYSGDDTQKPQQIHLCLCDTFHVKSVRMGTQRCSCGGWTFSTIWGGAKVVCRHCGKTYFQKEYETLEQIPLTPSQREDRRIYAMLLAGGDLREDKERDVLILKDRMGLPEGELPMEYARHFITQYAGARIIKDRRKPTAVSRHLPQPLTVAV